MAAQSPSAAKSTVGAFAPDLTTLNLEALVSRLAELNASATRDRESEARTMLEMGRVLAFIKETVRNDKFISVVTSIGLDRKTSSQYMKAALWVLWRAPETSRQKFLALGKSGLLELMRLDEGGFERLARSGEYCGLRLDELPGMTVMEIRRAVKSINEDDEQAHALMPDKLAAIDAILGDGLQVGDVVESRYSKRPGRVVKIYPDGSASVCWQDAEPQPEGMGHERMPRELLRLVERPAQAAPVPETEAHESDCWGRPIRHAIIGEPDAKTRPDPEQEPLPVDPARVMKHMEISAILKAIAAKVPTAPASAPTQNPLPADPAARPENVICMQEARLRSSAMTAAELAARDPARLKAYCADLLPLLIENAGAADLETLAMVLEEMIADQVRARPLPDVVAARYAIYCRLWLEGGAK